MEIYSHTIEEENKFYVKQSNQFINLKYLNDENGEVDRDEYLIGYQICGVHVIKNDDQSKLNEMQIFIKTIDDKILTFEMEHSNKIRDVKMKIEEKTKLSADQQNLFFQGEILNDDNKTIDEYQICEQSVINIVARLRGGMRIFAKSKDGRTVVLEVLKSDRIIDIKFKIQEKLGLHPDEQKLVYHCETLDDNKTIGEYQIHDEYVINVAQIGGMQILIQTRNGKQLTLKSFKSDKLIDIKKKIQEKIEICPDEQKLFYQGRMLNDDDKSIDEYQICDKSVINIIPRPRGKFQILAITMDRLSAALVVQNSDEIIDIKKKIQEKFGLPPEEQILYYHCDALDDNKTIDDYQISENCSINIVTILRGGTRILAEILDGITFSIQVEKSDKIIEVKKKSKRK